MFTQHFIDLTPFDYSLLLIILTLNWTLSLSIPTFGRSGIICATILKPASLANLNVSHTALTVCPRFVSKATSSYMDCTPVKTCEKC